MRIAIIGATGLVGSKMIQVLEESGLPIEELIPAASEKSEGKSVVFKGKEYKVTTPLKALAMRPDAALFSAGGAPSKQFAPMFAAHGIKVIDNSSTWRMEPHVKLIVPEVNAELLDKDDFIIANPNCSTIQLVVVLNPLHKKYKIKRVVVSTYQSVTGTGTKAVDQLNNERNGIKGPMAYHYPIDMNLIPQIDVFMDNGYTKEEMKMVNETKKIMGNDTIALTSTCVRVPVMGGHSESVNIEFENEYEVDEVVSMLKNTPGVVLQNDDSKLEYPMPMFAHEKNEIFVGRIRRDDTQPKTLNLWIVSDNLRKGAATNAVQILSYLYNNNLLNS